MDESSLVPARVSKKRKRGGSLTTDQVIPLFHLPLHAAATQLGIGVTILKKKCRALGIQRWPARRVRSIRRQLQATPDQKAAAELQTQILSFLDDPSKTTSSKPPTSTPTKGSNMCSTNTIKYVPEVLPTASPNGVEYSVYPSTGCILDQFQDEDELLSQIFCHTDTYVGWDQSERPQGLCENACHSNPVDALHLLPYARSTFGGAVSVLPQLCIKKK
jgi:hypothetical protein